MAKPKNLNEVVDGERYRTSVSWLLADDGESTFLLRALNSNYFVQREGEQDTIEVLPELKALELYRQLPNKHQTLVASFPRSQGGVGMDTESSYDDEDEKERLAAMSGQTEQKDPRAQEAGGPPGAPTV